MLIGASGSGKTTWARARYATGEVVSSDTLRAMVGSGKSDLEATDDAFALLDRVVGARVRRGMTTVIDTLGLDPGRRAEWIALGRAAGLPVLAVRFDTAPDVCRRRNRGRDRPVAAPALTGQLRRMAALDLTGEGFDQILTVSGQEVGSGQEVVSGQDGPADVPTATATAPASASGNPLRFALQVSSFPWGTDPRGWLASVARAAEQVGFSAIAVMDHLLQIPQVGRAWDPLPEAYVTLAYLAGVTEQVELGALVSPVTFRSAPLLAKIVASLDAVSGGRAFCGLGAGWYAREHTAYGLPFPSDRDRLDRLEATIGVLRAFWGPGTRGVGELPESTCYPRPTNIPLLVGGGGERRTLDIAARLADGCNVPSVLPVLDRKLDVLRDHLQRAGRAVDEFRITVLDVPIVGHDPDGVAHAVERHRGRTSATAYAAAHHAGVAEQHIQRYRTLAARGVDTVFVAFPDLAGPAEIERFAPIVQAFPAPGALRTV